MPTASLETSALLECPSGPFRIPQLAAPDLALSVIVPTYEEAGNIQDFLTVLCFVLDRILPQNYEVVVVDDDSPDLTWSLAASLAKVLPAIRVIRRTKERGLASAVVRGYQAARGAVLGTINADFQHPPTVLPAMLKLLSKADVAVASRFCRGGSTGHWAHERVFLSRAAFQAGRLLLPHIFSGLSDPLSGYYLFKRTTAEDIRLEPIGFKTLIELLARGRAESIAECPYQMQKRRSGISKVGLDTPVAYLKHLRRLKSPHAA